MPIQMKKELKKNIIQKFLDKASRNCIICSPKIKHNHNTPSPTLSPHTDTQTDTHTPRVTHTQTHTPIIIKENETINLRRRSMGELWGSIGGRICRVKRKEVN